MHIGSLMQMRISVRLGLGFAMVLLFTGVVGAFAIQSVTSVATLTANLYEHPFAVTKGLLEMRVAVRGAQRAVRDQLLADDAAERDRSIADANAQIAAAVQALKTARTQFLGDPTGFDRAASAIADYQKAADTITALARQDKPKDAIAYLHGPGAQAVQALTQAMDPLIAFATDKAAAFMKGAEAKRGETVFVNLLLIGGAVLLGAVVAFFATRSITRPLAGLRQCMAALADGKHDIAVPGVSRGDEIGEMAKAVEVFRQNSAEMVRLRSEQEAQKQRATEAQKQALRDMADRFETGIKGVVGSVAAQAVQMQSSAQAMTHTAELATQQATAVAASVEQASANVQTVASSAEELSSSVLEIGRQVEQSSKIAGQAVTDADRTNTTVEGLNRTAQRIGEVVQLIETIASQTNLLALNATIEAARAGDAGKGFAVVASEVKSLASQTGKATEDIRAQIGEIQGATGQTVEAIRSIGATIRQMSEIAASIASAVEQQGAATREIATNVHQAAQGTNDIASNIEGVSRAASDTGAAAAQVLSAAGELSKQSETLRHDVDTFLATVRAA
ncbi:MAG TPA: methyl-accepting chemotaxis protein [Acetobacteraceae bacterium]|nr:methyl-accepting chemotaxis protein [Acetobacteraceae bacterium]